MCGIAGIYNFKKEKADLFLIKEMVSALKHRGPDGAGFFVKDNMALGHARLSVIDLSDLGSQPMANEDNTLQIVFNGEIYNFKELRNDLEKQGHKFKSKTDTEVILHGYEQWGKECVKKLEGMFAFAVFDEKNNTIFLARDRMGEKPLYYLKNENKFIFASEIKSILRDKSIKREVSPEGMENFFAFGNSIAPDTIYKGVKKLLPGHSLFLEKEKITIEKYWSIPVPNFEKDQGEEFYKKKTLELLEDSVKARLVSDVPLGVFLSGGVDSSSIVALMSKMKVSSIKTFSVGFDFLGKEFNELSDAKIVAEHFKTNHHEIIIKEPDLVETLNKLVYHFDEPFGDAANFPVFLMSKFAKEHVSVVLSGDGSDEIFGGYRRYAVEKEYASLPVLKAFLSLGIFKKQINRLPGLRRTKKLLETMLIKNNAERHFNWLAFFSQDMRQSLFLNDVSDVDVLKSYKEYFKDCKETDSASQMMYLDQKILLPDRYLEKMDKASMAWGLEVRPPFLDHKLVEFANSIPLKYKIKGFKTKQILKESLKGMLPESVLNKKKHGFAVPINPWFKGKLKKYLFEVIFDKSVKEKGYLNYEYIEKLYKDYEHKNNPYDAQLWLILNFELWHRQFMENK